MIHTISHFQTLNPTLFLSRVEENDVILFWQDGVYFAQNSQKWLNKLLTKNVMVYAIKEDILARGLTQRIDERVHIIDMPTCVTLTANYFYAFIV